MQPGPARPALAIASALSTAAVLATMLAPAASASLSPGRLLPARTATAQGSRQLAATRRTLARSAAASTVVTVRRGSTLSGIARQVYGHAADWPVLFWANRAVIGRWADELQPGQRLRVVPLPRRIPAPPARTRPMPPAAPTAAPVPGSSSSTGTAAAVPPAPTAAVIGSGTAPGGAFGACVRQAENGGSYAWGTGNGGGAYQFLPSTWAAYGGNPADWGSASPAEQDRVFANAIAAGGQGNWSPYDGCPAGLSTTAAHSGRSRAASPPVHLLALMRQWVGYRGWHALMWAKAHARGKPYVWAGAGPNGFDCSGLVMAAYGHAVGRWLPHSTYSMLASGMLVRARHPRPGYLAFFGSGHVELYLGPGWTFGAHHSGTVVGPRRWSAFWHPTVFMRLR